MSIFERVKFWIRLLFSKKVREQFFREQLLKERLKQRQQEREEQSIKNAKEQQERIALRRARCTHRKGGRIQGPDLNYNVSRFVFIDGSTVIKCLSCGDSWTPNSIEWGMAARMSQLSSNTVATSEIPNEVLTEKMDPKAVRSDEYYKRLSSRQSLETTYDPDVPGQPDNPIKGIKH